MLSLNPRYGTNGEIIQDSLKDFVHKIIYSCLSDKNLLYIRPNHGCVAQVVRALCSHRRGHKFKSCHTYH